MRPIDADAYAAEMKKRQDACMQAVENASDEGEQFSPKEHWEGVLAAFAEAKLTLDDMPTVATDINVTCKWIPVKDRLPGTDDEVLTTYLYDDKPNKRYIESASYFDDGDGEGHWCSVWDEFSGVRVRKTTIAWMPMPKPYKPPKED